MRFFTWAIGILIGVQFASAGRFDVTILGAGPAGLTAALEAASSTSPSSVRVFESRPRNSWATRPQIVTLTEASMRQLARLGVRLEGRDAPQPLWDVQVYTGLGPKTLPAALFLQTAGGHRFTHIAPLASLERLLLERAQAVGIHIEFERSVPLGEIDSRWVIIAAGGNNHYRNELGIDWLQAAQFGPDRPHAGLAHSMSTSEGTASARFQVHLSPSGRLLGQAFQWSDGEQAMATFVTPHTQANLTDMQWSSRPIALGLLSGQGRTFSFAASLRFASTPLKIDVNGQAFVLIGDALRITDVAAGMGTNVALLDAASLGELLRTQQVSHFVTAVRENTRLGFAASAFVRRLSELSAQILPMASAAPGAIVLDRLVRYSPLNPFAPVHALNALLVSARRVSAARELLSYSHGMPPVRDLVGGFLPHADDRAWRVECVVQKIQR